MATLDFLKDLNPPDLISVGVKINGKEYYTTTVISRESIYNLDNWLAINDQLTRQLFDLVKEDDQA